jgi:rare lipoprotein A
VAGLLLAFSCARPPADSPVSSGGDYQHAPEHAPEYAADDSELTLPRSGVRYLPAPADAELAARFSGAPALAVFVGRASYYSDRFAGKNTASGQPYDPALLTAAHRTLPFGSIVRVIRTDIQRTVYVRVNDRGPFGSRQRILDVSRAAAAQLDMLRAGVIPVRAELVHAPKAAD